MVEKQQKSCKKEKEDQLQPINDIDCLKIYHKFIHKEPPPKDNSISSYYSQMSYKYSQKLYKQFVIIDLSQYKTGCVGMRWRTEKEVLSGKGEGICAAKGCQVNKNIEEYQVNFAYKEMGEKKNAEVRVRVCAECAVKMNYKKQYKKIEKNNFQDDFF